MFRRRASDDRQCLNTWVTGWARASCQLHAGVLYRSLLTYRQIEFLNPPALPTSIKDFPQISLVKIWARFNSSSWSGHDSSLPLTLWQSSYLTTQAHSYRNHNRWYVKVQGCGTKSWDSFFPIYILSVKQMSGMVLKLQLGTIKQSRSVCFFLAWNQ